MAEELVATEIMPQGNNILPVRRDQVEIEGEAGETAVWQDDAAASLVWQNYQKAKGYIENNTWLLEWQHTDILYQSPTLDRFPRADAGRPVRISRYLVAKNTRTMATQVKRALFAEQVPFFLRPTGETDQETVDAWTALLMKLLERMNFRYFCGLLIDCQVLQGTGIGKAFWDEKTVIRKKRVRKEPPAEVEMPIGGTKKIPTEESDKFDVVPEEVVESWPRFEYRRLGTTMFDPKTCTPNRPDLSGSYRVDVDFVTFHDLEQMRKLECYKNIPEREALLKYFFQRPAQNAPAASQVSDSLTAMGSAVPHAEGENRDTGDNPLDTPLMLIEMCDETNVQTILYYDGHKLIIRNEAHEDAIIHFTANWWNIDNNLYGMGLGRLNGPDQRINQGVINECLKMIAYPFNAPLLLARGDNAPTQNVIQRFGGFWAMDLPPGGNIRNAAMYLETPPVPADAWKMLQLSQSSADDISGANAPFMQGNLPGPGSSAARTATGAGRVAAKADDSFADPVDAVADGVIVRLIQWLIEMVKKRMPLKEIREILSKKDAAIISKGIFDDEKFMNAEMEVTVLAGQRLQARQGIQQILPMIMQVFQQPQLLEFLHQRGDTIDFAEIIDLLIQVSELQQQPKIIRPLTQQEQQSVQQLNPAAQRTAAATNVEKLKGQNKIAEIHAKSQDDLANKAAELAMEKTSEGIPLEHAEGLVERAADENYLRGGLAQ